MIVSVFIHNQFRRNGTKYTVYTLYARIIFTKFYLQELQGSYRYKSEKLFYNLIT